MMKEKNKELIRTLGLNPYKPDSFQLSNEPLMNSLHLWSTQDISFQNLIQSYFNVKVKSKLVAFLLDIDIANWVGIGASWQEKNQTGQIRIDSSMTEFLFNKAFGLSFTNQPFDIKKLNELELTILQTFLENIEEEMKKYWEVDPKHPQLLDTIYLVWLVESEDGEIGRIAFGVPASFKPKIQINSNSEVADISKLAETGTKVPINFTVGTTKLSYTDVKQLESGDLLIFENSDTSKFNWHFGEISTVLPEESHPAYLKDVENVEDLAENMNENITNLNDDPLSTLPLELSAEFQKVKIPLKKVLELKSGGVLPLGSVLDSQLTLTAQGKPVAKGELVIVGNQFGMRIYDLLIGTKNLSSAGAESEGIELNDVPQEPVQEEEPINVADELPNFEDELKGLEEEE